MLERGFWITRRGSIALILGTPQSELDRLVAIAKEGRRELASLTNPTATASPTNGYHSAIRPASSSTVGVPCSP